MSAGGKVLLVEDEVLVAALAVDALEELGYQTLEVTTARAAREIACGYGEACVRGRGHRIARWPGRCARPGVAQGAPGLPIVIATGYGGCPSR